jgi:MFS family permease
MVGSGLMGMFLFLTYYFQENLGYSALKTGFAFLPFSAGIILAAGASSKIIPRTGPKPVMVGGFSAATLGMLWLTQIGAHTSFTAHVLPAEILISIGMGLAFVPMSSTALFGVSPHDAGVASATLNATQQIGGSLGIALLNTVFASSTAAYLATRVDTPAVREAAQIHGYVIGFVIGAAFLVVATLSALFLVKASKADMEAISELEVPVPV